MSTKVQYWECAKCGFQSLQEAAPLACEFCGGRSHVQRSSLIIDVTPKPEDLPSAATDS